MIRVYTDGSSLGNPWPWGWWILVLDGEVRKTFSGGEQHTTNNRMELFAVINALKIVYEMTMWKPLSLPTEQEQLWGLFGSDKRELCDADIEIITDSSYVQQGSTEWIYTRKQNNWRTSSRKPVQNQDLRQELDFLMDHFTALTRSRTKAHVWQPENECVDKLAKNAAKKQ